MAFSRSGLTLSFLVLAGTLGAACGDDDGPNANPTLTIVAPVNSQVVTGADDDDESRAGIQFDVQLRSTGLSTNDIIEILLDGSTTASTMPAGTSLVEVPVTLPAGQHTLRARVAARTLDSNEVTFRVEEGGGGCGTVRFEMPAAPAGTGSVRLGPDDDTDGEPCGATFSTNIVVGTDAPDATEARLTVNGMVRSMARVSGGRVTFADVRLDNRGDTPNRFSVAVGTGAECDEMFPASVLVECAGPSCSIAQPTTDRTFLNASDDTSAAAGFQTDFHVVTDASAIGENANLVIDDAPADGATVAADPEGGRAIIGNVALSEGEHRVRAECRDAEGNVTSSSEATWTVDSVPCAVTIASPGEGELLSDASDLDPDTTGVQITILGSTTGDDCEAARGGACMGIDAAAFEDLRGLTDLALLSTLGSAPRQDLCAQVRDTAGNVGEARVSINFRSNAPQLEITTPAAGTSFNAAGDATHTADLDTATPTCEAAFSVRCTELDAPVVLSLDGDATRTALPGGTAMCTAAAGLPDPFVGEAVFASVSLPRTPAVAIVASQVAAADGLVGLSDRLALTGDCEAPTFAIVRPTCGDTLDPTSDDEDPGVGGLQYRVQITNANEPPPDVTLEIRSGPSVVYRETSTMRVVGGNSFPAATFGSGGSLAVEGCGTDDFGNRGCTPACTVTVSGLPSLSIVTPAGGGILGLTQDCDMAAAGLQLSVVATTDAADGAAASVTIGSAAPVMTTVSGGQVRVCTDAADGTSVPVTVVVDDARGRATATVRISIDTMTPGMPITDLAATVVDRRRGTVRFTWTSVADTGGGALLLHQLRCGRAAIVTEADWSAARTVAIGALPAAAGTMQMEVVPGFRTGFREECSLRALDGIAAMTPIGNSAVVDAAFVERELGVAVPSTSLGFALAAIGDVNGDGIDDVLAGGAGAAYVYFGSTTALPATPSIVLLGAAADAFGNVVAGIGDVNDDEIADFAVTAYSASGGRGAVYVFFGRDAVTSWPTTIDVAFGGCGADLCLTSDDGVAGSGPDEVAYLGGSVAAAGDFDGDGVDDLAIGANAANGAGASFPGLVYVLLGGASLGGSASLPGTAGTTLRGFVVSPPAGIEQLGYGVAGIGDLTADGRDDLIIGAGGTATAESAVLALAGRAYAGTGIVAIAGTELGIADRSVGYAIGTVLVNAGDVDGNGTVDVGTYSTARSGGQARYYLGAAGAYSLASATFVQNDAASPADDAFGYYLATGAIPSALVGATGVLGDIDGDGLCDLLVGANQLDTTIAAGQLYYSGLLPAMPTEFQRSVAHATLSPASALATGGRVPQFVGDVNADGFLDVAVGDPGHLAGTGRVVVYH